MLSHVHIGTNDLDRSLAFYGAVMAELGYAMKFHEPENGWAAFMQGGMPRPLFIIGRPYDGRRAEPGNGTMTALLAPSREAVDRAYAAAIARGGICEGPPGQRPQYHADYYGAYCRDPDGNKLCFCCHDPAATV